MMRLVDDMSIDWWRNSYRSCLQRMRRRYERIWTRKCVVETGSEVWREFLRHFILGIALHVLDLF